MPGLRRIGPDELREIEPHAAGIAALHSPGDRRRRLPVGRRAMADELPRPAGGSSPAAGSRRLRPAVRLGRDRALRGPDDGPKAVLCAGPWADRSLSPPVPTPIRGSSPSAAPTCGCGPSTADLVAASIYPVPDPDLPFLGVHLTRNPAGEVLLGPTALIVGARDAYRLRRSSPRPAREARLARDVADDAPPLAHRADRDRPRGQPAFVRRRVRRYVPELRLADVDARPLPGVRAQAIARDGSLVDDFVISETERAIHVRNAPSPAATSSLALAELIADRVDSIG